jgi:hypothetical protein
MYLIQICLQETEWNKLPAVFRITWKSLEAIGWKILYAGMETDEREVIFIAASDFPEQLDFPLRIFFVWLSKSK